MIVILVIILFIAGIYLTATTEGYELASVGTILIFVSGIALGLFFNESEIEPIDVYRDKTELKIKIIMEDSVIIRRDSTVVLKTR